MRPYVKITKVKRAGAVSQVVECLPSKCKVMKTTLVPSKIKSKDPLQ
jgi:hypothetical protein